MHRPDAPGDVYRMVARETIEEKVVALARRKAALFKGVMEAGDLFASSLSAETSEGCSAEFPTASPGPSSVSCVRGPV